MTELSDRRAVLSPPQHCNAPVRQNSNPRGGGQAHEVAEQAARDYRARAGDSYSADREELARLATLAAWAMRQFAGLRKQVDATDDAAQSELATILDRLRPILGTADASEQVPSYPYQGPDMSGH